MPRLYIDIETLPTQREDVIDRIHTEALDKARNAPPPANYKKDEIIAKWRADREGAAADEADYDIERTALNGGYGELCCICWALDDGDVEDAVRGRDGGEVMLLHRFFDDIRKTEHTLKWIGHNVEFDIRFIHHRSIITGVRSPHYLPANDPPWKGTYYDTMKEWAGLRGAVKLTMLCDMLGIDISDDDIDGSQVWQAWQDGRVLDILDHCRRDVERVREIYRRMTWR